MATGKKPKISNEEQSLFREAMRGVKPIAQPKKVTIEPPRPTPRRKKQSNTESLDFSPFSDYERLDPVSSDALIEFNRPGIQHKVLRKLRTGQYNVEAILDLHGMIVVEARDALHRFIMRCQEQGIRHVLIIHGKGRHSDKPILKNKLNHWLRETEQILAFCSATVKNGRSGALYVLLKNQKGEIES